MFRKILNSSIISGLSRAANKNVRISCHPLSSQTQAPLVQAMLTPSGVCRSPLTLTLHRCCSRLSSGEDATPHDNTLASQTEEVTFLESDPQRRPEVFNIDVLVALLRQENAQDICVIRVPRDLKYTEYFVVVSGTSTRHLRAMAFYAVKVYKFMKGSEDPHVQIEGKDAEDWICIDFGDMVIHFMLPQTRETYELEKLWTLRHYDDQLRSIPPETLPSDFIYGVDAHK